MLLLANQCGDQAVLLDCIRPPPKQDPQTALPHVSFASAVRYARAEAAVRELARDVYGYISDFDPNCGFVVADDHVVLIDTRPTPRMARDFLADIRTVTDKPVRFIVLTHYHAVRVMGASAFAEAQAVIASNGTPDWVRERGQADFDSEVGRFPRLFAGVEEIPGLTATHLNIRAPR